MGRQKTYESIVKGDSVPKPGVPESFKVMVSELQGLGLDIRILDDMGKEIDLKEDYDEDDSTSYGKQNFSEDYRSDDDDLNRAGFEVTDAEDAGGVVGDDDSDMYDDDDEYDDEDADFDDGLDDDDESEYGDPSDSDDEDDGFDD